MDESIAIFRLFSREFGRELTINQIAKATGKSYSFTNKIVKGLIQQDLLQGKTIGHAIVCKANYHHPLTRQFLALASALEAWEFRKSLPEERQKHLSTLLSVLRYDILAASYIQEQLYILTKDETSIKGDFELVHVSQFRDFVKKHGIGTLIAGYEKYWEVVGEHSD